MSKQRQRGSRKPAQPFKCLALDLGISLMDTVKIFVNIFAPPLRAASAPSVSSTTLSSYDLGEGRALGAYFFVQEFEAALRILRRKSAPGPDSVTNQMLKNLPDAVKTGMLAWFNNIWDTCRVPASYKTACIVPTLKSGKPYSVLAS